MSQSPIDDFSERTVMRYRQGWKALSRLLHEDRSFSGHERNCAFLNTGRESGGQRFADVSAASGLDFDDDGRAVALSDWDFDGDLDIWITNRTAPRVRLLRNNNPHENHFLAIRLQGDGEGTNRDAIGARVEVLLGGDQPRPLIKTLAAGDGFLSQSSSWLHFGLGNATQIRQVVVHWPGGQREQYENFEVDRRYVIDQQNGRVKLWNIPGNRKPLESSKQRALPSSDIARTVLPARRLLPTLTAEGRNESLNSKLSGPTVITIWSSTCISCVKELQEFTRHADRIREAGLDVIAINLDNLEDGDSQHAESILASIEFPFTAVSGTIELVRSLDILKRAIFDRWQTLSVPTSFLVNERGFVCVLYQGPVQIAQLLSDLKILRLPSGELRQLSAPFAGRWIMPATSADPLPVTTHFVDEAMIKNGMDYLARHARIVEKSALDLEGQEPGDLYYVLAILLRDQEQIDESLEAFRKAIEFRPDDFRFRDDFANLLAKTEQLSESAEQLQHCLRINPQDISVQRKLGFIRMAEGNSSEAIERFTNVIKAQPNDVACWYNLANAYRANGQLEEAMKMYRQTLKIQPKMTLAANNLAWVLSTHPESQMRNGAEAVEWAKRVCEQTKYAQPAFLDTLGCAYAEFGQFEKAIAISAKAARMYADLGQSEAASDIQARIQLFQQSKPYRDDLR